MSPAELRLRLRAGQRLFGSLLLTVFTAGLRAADQPGALPRLIVLDDAAQRYPAPGEPLFTQR